MTEEAPLDITTPEKYRKQIQDQHFGILRYAEKYLLEALERCCKNAILAEKCNYSYICNTISTYHKVPLQSPAPHSESNKNISASISGTYKDDDSKYSLRNLLKRQETEGGYEE